MPSWIGKGCVQPPGKYSRRWAANVRMILIIETIRYGLATAENPVRLPQGTFSSLLVLENPGAVKSGFEFLSNTYQRVLTCRKVYEDFLALFTFPDVSTS
jgi:hypothetical protein